MDYKDAWDKQQSSSGSGKPYSPQDYPLYNPNDPDAGSLNSQWENYIFGDWADNSGGSSSSSGGGYGGGYGNAYQKQLDAIRKQQQAEEQRLRDQTANLIRQYEAQKPVLKQRFTDNAQDAYVQKMNTLKEMPQVLSAQGYNGGLSESSNIKVDNQYGNAYNGHQRDYNKGLADVDNQIANTNASLNDALSQNSTHYGGMLMNAEMSYQQMLMQAQQEAQAQKLQEQVRQQEQDKWQKQFDYQKEQDKIANELARQKFTAANAPKPTKPKEYKPTLSPSQVDNAIANGNYGKNVLEGYKYYYGEDYSVEQNTGLGNQEFSLPYGSYDKATGKTNNTNSQERIVVPGYGPITPEQLYSLVQANKVREIINNGKYYYEKV